MYRESPAALPDLASCALAAYPYTFSFIAGIAPLYALTRIRADEAKLRVGLWWLIGLILGLYTLWVASLWFGLYLPAETLHEVVGP